MLFLMDADEDVFEIINAYIETHDDISHLTTLAKLENSEEDEYATKLNLRQFSYDDATKELHYELYLIMTIDAKLIPKIKFGWDGTINVVHISKEGRKVERRIVWDIRKSARAAIDKFEKSLAQKHIQQ